MLQAITCASPPALLMVSATCWQASALRLEITTLAPSFASSSAEERPMPRLEPVTTATVPERSNGVFFMVGCLRGFSAVIARSEATKQSSFLFRGRCEAGLLRFARNDGERE